MSTGTCVWTCPWPHRRVHTRWPGWLHSWGQRALKRSGTLFFCLDDRATLVEKADTRDLVLLDWNKLCILGEMDMQRFLRNFQATGFQPHSCSGTRPAPGNERGIGGEQAYLWGGGRLQAQDKDVKPMGSLTEKMMSCKGCGHLTGTWEPGYPSCIVGTGVPYAESLGMMAPGPHTAPCPPAPTLGFRRPPDSCSTAPLGAGAAGEIRT